MWLFEFPNYVYHLILGIGIIGTITGFALNSIPFIKQYSFPIQVISIMVLTFGVYLKGGLAVKNTLDIKVADLKVKLANAEVLSEKINTVVVTKILTKKEIVKEKGATVSEYIDREVIKYNDRCEIPKSAVISHNAAAQNKTIDEVLTPNTAINTTDHNDIAIRAGKK